jgi:predicted transcriptional regulator
MLVPEVVRNDTAHIIGPELQAKIDKMKNLIDAGMVDNEASVNGTLFLF